MPHPKRSLEQEERALANSYVEHARRLNRSQAIAQQLNAVHPHFRHDFEPDAMLSAPTTPQRVIGPQYAPTDYEIAPYGALAQFSANRFRTRRRVTPR